MTAICYIPPQNLPSQIVLFHFFCTFAKLQGTVVLTTACILKKEKAFGFYPKYQKIAIFFTERIKQDDVLASFCRSVTPLSHSYNSGV
ncbi:hypothetical protein, partial [uncultured Bacteroides sp.]|uniref:hypothetical protein n=1 Tax=uncultured Bacteroides sp. TaxID=162156 RepID=UPI0026701DAA